MYLLKSTIIAALLLGSSGVLRAEEPARVPAQYTRLMSLVQPQAGEAQFEQVPWITFLWEARLKAAAEGKPIFIWAAGGPPGGC